jgi:hypothetical protein
MEPAFVQRVEVTLAISIQHQGSSAEVRSQVEKVVLFFALYGPFREELFSLLSLLSQVQLLRVHRTYHSSAVSQFPPAIQVIVQPLAPQAT